MIKIFTTICIALTLAACTGTAGLSPAMTDRMDAPGANLNRPAAIGVVNQFRASRGVAALAQDPNLDTLAQTLAAQYSKTGKTPPKPAAAGIILTSAGYATLADTFSGWRSGGNDAAVLADPTYSKAGIGVAYTPNSNFGVHWVMLLAPTNVATAQ